MSKNTHKIYYFTYNYDAPNNLSLKMTVIFDIPFYQIETHDSPYYKMWVPFLGFQTKPHPTIQMLYIRRPSLLGNPGVKTNELLPSLKSCLISAIIGGGYWDTDDGVKHHAMLKREYGLAFINYHFKMADSGKHVYRQTNDLKYINEVNDFLSQGSSKNFSDFDFNDWEKLQNLDVFKNPGNKASSLVFEQPKITSFFPRVFPRHQEKHTPVKYPIHIPNNSCPQDVITSIDNNVINYIKSEYDHILKDYRENADANTIAKFRKYSTVMIVFLNNGHVVAFDENTQPFKKILNGNLFPAFALTTGEMVMVKVSGTINNNRLPSLLSAARHNYVIDILGIGFGMLNNRAELALITPIYDTDLSELLDKVRLSFIVKENIFRQLLSGLSKIHATPILFENIRGKLFHADIKTKNIFVKLRNTDMTNVIYSGLSANNFELCFADLDGAGHYNSCTYTLGYLSPDLAEYIINQKSLPENKRWVGLNEFHIKYAHASDIWALGVTLAEVLQQRTPDCTHGLLCIKNTLRYSDFSLIHAYAPLGFTREKYLALRKSKNISQMEINSEIDRITKLLPNTTEGNKLRAMWSLVESMLQVKPENRPTVFELSKQFNSMMQKESAPKLKQALITKYTVKKEDGTLTRFFKSLQLIAMKIYNKILEIYKYFFVKPTSSAVTENPVAKIKTVTKTNDQNSNEQENNKKKLDLFWAKNGFKIKPKQQTKHEDVIHSLIRKLSVD